MAHIFECDAATIQRGTGPRLANTASQTLVTFNFLASALLLASGLPILNINASPRSMTMVAWAWKVRVGRSPILQDARSFYLLYRYYRSVASADQCAPPFSASLLSSHFCVVPIIFAIASEDLSVNKLMEECLLVLFFVEEMKTPI
jgi:hypothetical protein